MLVDYLEEQIANRGRIEEDLAKAAKRGLPTLSSLLPPVKLKHSGAKSPQTRERTRLDISLSTSNNLVV